MVSIKKVIAVGELVPIENSQYYKQKRVITLEERTDFWFNEKSGKLQVLHEQENANLYDDDALMENIGFQVDDFIIADIRHSVNADGYQHNKLYRYAKVNRLCESD